MENQKEKVTLQDIADRLSVSKMTVSLALRGSKSVSKERRKLICEVAKEMGYKPSYLFSKAMSLMKKKGLGHIRENIALINANERADAFTNLPTIPQYVSGIRKAAHNEGFSISEFWLNDPELNARNLMKVLRFRGIKGGIIVGLMENNNLSGRFDAVWRNFKFVVTGVRTYNPTLNYVCTDHFLVSYHATMRAIKNGYKRPALVLDRKIDDLIEGRFTGGFLKAVLSLNKADRIDPFFDVQQANEDISIFRNFFKKNKPDCIISLYNSPVRWLGEIGVDASKDIGFIQLEYRGGLNPRWCGMNQRNDLVGESAVFTLRRLLSDDSGISQNFVTATLVSPEWVD